MQLVKAKCTSCGGDLEVNPEADCLICKYCGSPFIVDKAIANYNTTINNTVVNNVKADNVIVNGFDAKAEIKKARIFVLENDDNISAARLYEKIYQNDPTNIEAKTLRVYLNEETKTVNVKKETSEYNPSLRIYVTKNYTEAEDQPVYDEYEKEEALEEFLNKANVEDEDLKEFGKAFINSQGLLSRDKLNKTDCINIERFFGKDEMREKLIAEINTKVETVRTWAQDKTMCDYAARAKRRAESLAQIVIERYQPNYTLPSMPEIRKAGGCYVATCVYNSYDCPEVWRLRRYRDNYLDNHWWGRLFIKLYYKVSPTLVKWFGKKNWFRKPIKSILDRKINKLKKKGYDDTPYMDKY